MKLLLITTCFLLGHVVALRQQPLDLMGDAVVGGDVSAKERAAASMMRSGGADRFRRPYQGGASVAVTSSVAAPAAPLPTLGLNLQSFGCLPNGQVCGPQFQEAIYAAMKQGRALLVLAGMYKVNQTLIIPMGKLFRMVGEGKYLTTISAAVDGMQSIFNASWGGVAAEGTNVEISELTLHAQERADYCLYAPGITRSIFNRVVFVAALKAGCFHGGWINVFSQCTFNANHGAGLEMANNNGNVVVDGCSIEENPGKGIWIHGAAAAISITNSVIEGNHDVAIWANEVDGLAIRSCYFEYNQYIKGPATFSYGTQGLGFGGNLTVFADIILDGVMNENTHPPQRTGHCRGVELVGNTFCPHGGQRTGFMEVPLVAFLLAAVEDGTMSDNRLTCYNSQTSLFLISTNPFFSVKGMTIGPNYGMNYPSNPNFPTNFYLHDSNVSFSPGQSPQGLHMDFEKNTMLPGIEARGFTFTSEPGATLASGWTNAISTDGRDLEFEQRAASRLQHRDSAVVSLNSSGTSKVYGQWFDRIYDAKLDNLPVISTLWVKALTPATVFTFTLVLYPGAGAPPLKSAEFPTYSNGTCSDEWVKVSLSGLLSVPTGGQAEGEQSGIGIQISNHDSGVSQVAQVAIGGFGPNLVPVGMNPPTGFYRSA